MFNRFNREQLLGLFFVVLAIVMIVLWIPMDSDSLYFFKHRRTLNIGDGLAPTLAAVIILGSSLLLLFSKQKDSQSLTLANLWFVVVLIIGCGLSFLIMRYTGPVLAVVLTDSEYRLLRADFPWKYLGFVLGGTLLVVSPICLIERRLSWAKLLIGLVATLFIAVFYGVLFDSLQLPPNGDV
jgi:hypothetical protein